MLTNVVALQPYWLAHTQVVSQSIGTLWHTLYALFPYFKPWWNKALNSWPSQLGPNKGVSSFPPCIAGKTTCRPVILNEWKKEKYGLQFFCLRFRPVWPQFSSAALIYWMCWVILDFITGGAINRVDITRAGCKWTFVPNDKRFLFSSSSSTDGGKQEDDSLVWWLCVFIRALLPVTFYCVYFHQMPQHSLLTSCNDNMWSNYTGENNSWASRRKPTRSISVCKPRCTLSNCVMILHLSI